MAALVTALAVCGCGGGSSASSTSSLSTVKNPEREAPRAQSTTTTGSKPPATTQAGENQAAARAPFAAASPTQTVQFALTSADIAVCEIYTRALLNRSFGGAQGCRSSIRSGGRADSVEIVSSSVKGDKALVVAVPHGGPSSAQKLQISLVRSGKHWQLASIKSNVPVGP